jgi:hypothetical protein
MLTITNNLLGYLQVVGGVVYPTNLRKNAKYTIHVVDNSQYHMNTLTNGMPL